MTRLTSLTLLLCALLCAPFAAAQTQDFGRGPVLVSAPANAAEATAMPLIVLLHGYTSSGQSITNYWGIGRLVEDYGFVALAFMCSAVANAAAFTNDHHIGKHVYYVAGAMAGLGALTVGISSFTGLKIPMADLGGLIAIFTGVAVSWLRPFRVLYA